MIPKIAHFHWDGSKPMSWLRQAGIRTFRKYHPDWEVRIEGTPSDIAAYNLPHKAQEADWSLWRRLHDSGGFKIDTDIVFIRPIPDRWCSFDEGSGLLNACRNRTRGIYQIAAVGASAGLPWMNELDLKCESLAQEGASAYQSMGVEILGDIPNEVALKMFDQPMKAFCKVDCSSIQKFWRGKLPKLGQNVIGVHWYGGAEKYRERELGVNGDEDYAIVKLAREQLEAA